MGAGAVNGSQAPWIVTMGNGQWLVCLCCHARERVQLPSPIDDYIAMTNRFIKRHTPCPNNPANWQEALNVAQTWAVP